METPAPLTESWVPLGYVARAHGIRGAVRVSLQNDHSEVLRPGVVVRVSPRVGADKSLRVRDVSVGGVVVFEGVADRDAADALRGATLSVERATLPVLDDDEMYLQDAIGMRCVDGAGAELGVVRAFLDGTPQPVAVVAAEDGRETLVPFVPGIVVEVGDDRIVLDPPAGLFSGLDDDT